MSRKVMKFLAFSFLTSSFLSVPAFGEVAPHMVSDWGKQIVDLLIAVEKLSAEPDKAVQTGMGVAGVTAGAKVGSIVGGALVGWAAGSDFRLAGNLLGGLFGASLGESGGESIGARVDQARNFLIKDRELLMKIDMQLTQLLSVVTAGTDAAVEISRLDNETRVELAAINAVLPTWYNPLTIADVRRNIPKLADNAQILSTNTDQLTEQLERN